MRPALRYANRLAEIYHANVMDGIPAEDGSVDCVVTSPPYFGLRDYGVPGQLGAEDSPAEYVENLRHVFADVRRVLASDGTLWLNLGDCYYSGRGASTGKDAKNPARRGFTRALDKPGRAWAKPKNLLGMPWRVALALQTDGWTLRNAIVWHKANPTPDPARDRASSTYEHVFMFSKSRFYHFDKSESGGDVWKFATQPFPGAHSAVFPPELPRRCIRAGCKPGGRVLDPFHGSGTTAAVAIEQGRRYVGVDLSAEYIDLSIHARNLTA